eukprot:gnl/Chilomastix_cuspidata/8694.p1 GENE.gnl/Chilomastix_cuspidata/8694~~gnl/Chilomastix_cuspidata/8694.p1  ORF type:complete len:199 (+),score=17.33 gnl/Chilomastix_cuspidata/8694:762-1358(+)
MFASEPGSAASARTDVAATAVSAPIDIVQNLLDADGSVALASCSITTSFQGGEASLAIAASISGRYRRRTVILSTTIPSALWFRVLDLKFGAYVFHQVTLTARKFRLATPAFSVVALSVSTVGTVAVYTLTGGGSAAPLNFSIFVLFRGKFEWVCGGCQKHGRVGHATGPHVSQRAQHRYVPLLQRERHRARARCHDR